MTTTDTCSSCSSAMGVTSKSCYPIPSSQTETDSPSGWSIAAIDNGQIIAVHEFWRISPEVARHLPIDADMAAGIVARWLNTSVASNLVEALKRLGRIAIGVAYKGKFHEA